MLKIDNSLLQEVGLGALPDGEKNSLLKHIYETLEMRVGIRLADQMSNEQLDEFERYFEAKDDAGAFKWLETNFPNYKEIVQEEFDKLKGEITQSAPQILANSQSGNPAAAAAPAIPAPGQPIQPTQPFQATEPPLSAAVPPPPADLSLSAPAAPAAFGEAAPPVMSTTPAPEPEPFIQAVQPPDDILSPVQSAPPQPQPAFNPAPPATPMPIVPPPEPSPLPPAPPAPPEPPSAPGPLPASPGTIPLPDQQIPYPAQQPPAGP